jgi:hypothetical protein
MNQEFEEDAEFYDVIGQLVIGEGLQKLFRDIFALL